MEMSSSEDEVNFDQDDFDVDDEWIPNSQNEFSEIEDVSAENNVVIEIESDNDSDIYLPEDVIPVCNDHQFLCSKDGKVWSIKPTYTGKMQPHNILRQRRGPVSSTIMLSICDLFKRFFDNTIYDIVIRQTNRKAKAVYARWNLDNPTKKKTWVDFTSVELDAFLGFLITAGVRQSSGEHISELFKSDAYPLYRAVMARSRFLELCRFIRFDDIRTRPGRLLTDKAAAIKDIWLILNSNLSKLYVPSDCIVVDEQLFPYRGRTRFTQYMPSKPAKYGIKVWWVCDASNSYPMSGQIYTGKSAEGRETMQGERVVKDLCHPFKNSGRNVTMDNFFTSLSLAQILLSWKMSMVGTLKKNKAFIPIELVAVKNRTPASSLFAFSEDGNVSLCSYIPKKNKNVLLMSTMHKDDAVSGLLNKPDIIQYYNKTKGGVDNMDKMLAHFSTKRRTSRWPLALFYNMLDVACLATYIIHKENNPEVGKHSNSRRVFLQELGKNLSLNAIRTRATNRQVTKHFASRLAIESLLGHPISYETETCSSATEIKTPCQVIGSCYLCRSTAKHQRKTRQSCNSCRKPICKEHSRTIFKCNSCT